MHQDFNDQNLPLEIISGNYNFTSPVTKDQIIDLALSLLSKPLFGEKLDSPYKAVSYYKCKLGRLEHEEFHVIYLNTQHSIICNKMLARGTINTAHVYPREVVKLALTNNASAIILVHNHPSGGGYNQPS